MHTFADAAAPVGPSCPLSRAPSGADDRLPLLLAGVPSSL